MKHLSYYREQDLRKVLVAIAIVIALITTLYATAALERDSNDGSLDRAGSYDASPDVNWNSGFDVSPDVNWNSGYDASPDVNWNSGFDASPDVNWNSGYDATPDVSWISDYNATPDGGYAWNG